MIEETTTDPENQAFADGLRGNCARPSFYQAAGHASKSWDIIGVSANALLSGEAAPILFGAPPKRSYVPAGLMSPAIVDGRYARALDLGAWSLGQAAAHFI